MKKMNRRLNFVALICAVAFGSFVFYMSGIFLLSVCAFVYDNDEIKAIEHVADEKGWSEYLTEKAEIREAIREERAKEDDIYKWCRMSMFSRTGVIVRNTVIFLVIIISVVSVSIVSFCLGAIGIVSYRRGKKIYRNIKKVVLRYIGKLKGRERLKLQVEQLKSESPSGRVRLNSYRVFESKDVASK